MKNDEQMQVEQVQPQYNPTQYPPSQFQQPQYPRPQYKQNQYPPQQQYPQPRGHGNFLGRGKQGGGGGFSQGRGPVVCYNYGVPGNYTKDFPEPARTCSYCRQNHNVEKFPQLISRWQAWTLGLANLILNLAPNLVPNSPNQDANMNI